MDILRFTKLHGAGNDYLYLDGIRHPLSLPDLPALARRLSDRHFGVGADGIILLLPSRTAHAAMRIFNADGSEGEMCGNGIRCAGKYLYESGLVRQTDMTIETKAGPRRLALHLDGGQVDRATVDMGVPEIQPARPITLPDRAVLVTPVSVGNPHAVVFQTNLEVEKYGPVLERHPDFPNRTNVEFVRVLAPDRLRVRVWERGSGETLACGTGACAAVAAAASGGRAGQRAEVELPGGVLEADWRSDGHIYLTGETVCVFWGEITTTKEGQ